MGFLRIAFLALFLIASAGVLSAKDINKFVSDLDSRDLRIRLSAVEELGTIRDEKAVDLLMNVADTKSENWEVKAKAIQLLGEIGDTKAVRLLISIHNDPFLNNVCPALKWYTAIALGNFKGDSKVVDSLINELNNDDLIVREATIQSLGKTGDSRAVPFLIPALQDKSFAIRRSAIKALEKIGDPLAIPYLRRVAENDGDVYIKNEALTALKNIDIKAD